MAKEENLENSNMVKMEEAIHPFKASRVLQPKKEKNKRIEKTLSAKKPDTDDDDNDEKKTRCPPWKETIRYVDEWY